MTTFTAQDQARVTVLIREIGMLQQAQRYLSGIPARHNAQRITQRQDELATLQFLAELDRRDDAEEVEQKARHAR
jgi:hypothetical protein